MKRIESGLHGPTLILEDDPIARMAWDEIEIHCYQASGVLNVTVYTPEENVLLDRYYTKEEHR